MWRQDVRGSMAWARALVGAGVLEAHEGELLLSGLEKVGQRMEGMEFSKIPDEDVHTLVERLLTEEIGPVAGKLHTGRSRNDQVATDFRLWGMGAAEDLSLLLERVLRGLLELADHSLEVIVPGHTHLQQAQPIRGAHWALSHFWPLRRDLNRIRGASDSADVLPLGSGALAGCPFPVDRAELAAALGFSRVSENSLDAVSDRDWAAELLFAGAMLGIHLSRLGEDLVILSTLEFGYLEIPEGFCTGSSLMPQKRNPDAAELVRGKAARLVGNLTGLLTLLKGLPSGYNRDLQEDKSLVFDTVDTLVEVLSVMAELLPGVRFRDHVARERLSTDLLATDLADHLVRQGIPFRESHHLVGRLVRAAGERGKPIHELPGEVLREIHPSLEPETVAALSFQDSVEAREVQGGTARKAVLQQMARARDSLSTGPRRSP
jgi:argininosuccinate lyase